MRVVVDMPERLNDHNIMCDHFFHTLAKELLKRKVTILVDSEEKNKPELPSEFLAIKNRKVTSLLFVFTDRATVISYCLEKGKKMSC